MGKYLGLAGTDVFGVVGEFIHTVRFKYTDAQMAASAVNKIIDAKAGSAAADKTFTADDYTSTFKSSGMPYARTLQMKASAACTKKVTIIGRDLNGEVIKEAVTLAGTSVKHTDRAFAEIISISIEKLTEGDANISVGWADGFGLPYKFDEAPLVEAYIDGTLETTGPTVVTDDDELAKNTITLNTALSGKDVVLYLRMV